MRKLIKALVAINAAVLLAAFVVKKLVPSEGGRSADVFVHSTVLIGSEFKSEADALRRGRVFTLLGGALVDLTAATLDPDAELDIFTVIGGVEVRIPPSWRVEAANSAMFGGAQLVLDEQLDLAQTAPVLRVRSRTIIGGVVITNRSRRRSTTSPI